MMADEREYNLIQDARTSHGRYESDVTLSPSSGRKMSWECEINHYLHSINKSWYFHNRLKYQQPGHAMRSIC
jgi:hypothetical protein